MEKLIEQQNALVAQMSVMQAEGFEYDGGLPEGTIFILIIAPAFIKMSQCMRFQTMWYVRPAKPEISLRMHAV